jgi:hypothetical protein
MHTKKNHTARTANLDVYRHRIDYHQLHISMIHIYMNRREKRGNLISPRSAPTCARCRIRGKHSAVLGTPPTASLRRASCDFFAVASRRASPEVIATSSSSNSSRGGNGLAPTGGCPRGASGGIGFNREGKKKKKKKKKKSCDFSRNFNLISRAWRLHTRTRTPHTWDVMWRLRFANSFFILNFEFEFALDAVGSFDCCRLFIDCFPRRRLPVVAAA